MNNLSQRRIEQEIKNLIAIWLQRNNSEKSISPKSAENGKKRQPDFGKTSQARKLNQKRTFIIIAQ